MNKRFGEAIRVIPMEQVKGARDFACHGTCTIDSAQRFTATGYSI